MKMHQGIPWRSVVRTTVLSLVWPRFRSLVKELGSHSHKVGWKKKVTRWEEAQFLAITSGVENQGGDRDGESRREWPQAIETEGM